VQNKEVGRYLRQASLKIDGADDATQRICASVVESAHAICAAMQDLNERLGAIDAHLVNIQKKLEDK